MKNDLITEVDTISVLENDAKNNCSPLVGRLVVGDCSPLMGRLVILDDQVFLNSNAQELYTQEWNKLDFLRNKNNLSTYLAEPLRGDINKASVPTWL